MKRRTLLGSAAMTFGGASLLGTHAFTSVEAERSISIDVQEDGNAFLELAPCDEDSDVEIDHDESISRDFDPSNVVDDDDRDISIDLTGSNPDLGGSGITNNAVWRFPKALRIKNAGSQPVCVDVQLVNTNDEYPRVGLNESENVNIDIDGDEDHEKTISSEDPAVVFYSGDSSENHRFSWDKLDTGSENAIHLEPSGSKCIGFNIRTFGFNHDSAQLKGLTLRIRADTNAGCAEEEEEEEEEEE